MKKFFRICILFFMLISLSACGKDGSNEDTKVIQTSEEQIEQTTDAKASSLDAYEGEYNDYDNDEPNLEIKKNDDGTYQIQIGIFRLIQLDDCVGNATDEGIQFSTTFSDNEISGIITLEDDIATVTFTSEGWSVYSSINEYKYHKTSDTPNILK